jgi:alpha-1,2-mannosyltransferase
VVTSRAPSTGLSRALHPSRRHQGRWLLAAGVIAFAAALALYGHYLLTHPRPDWMVPVDLRIYRFAGFVVRHQPPWYKPGLASPLYDMPLHSLMAFTYTPFAAMVFTILTVPYLHLLLTLSILVNITMLVVAIWATFTGLGYRAGLAKAGATLLVAGAVFWTEPVQRTLFLGQVELVLMALIMWDLCQPDRHWWKGAGVGIAAGIKLVPLIFIPYLLLTRKFRQAAVATATFAVTTVLGFAVLPADSRYYWFNGIFAKGSRTGFVGWGGNQSLRAIITRLAGSVAAGDRPWLVAAALTLVIGLLAAALLDRAGYPVVGILTCALTGLLVSPISWDHHWVWIVPAVAVAGTYAVRASGALRWAWLGLAAAIIGIFAAWPVAWSGPLDPNNYYLGLIWLAPVTSTLSYAYHGDKPFFPEYHWHGVQLLAGNSYILAGLLLMLLLVGLAVRSGLASGALTRLGVRRPARS